MIKENDFIEISYTGRLKENDGVFDTTDETVAKEAQIFNPQYKYKPMIVEIGRGHLIKGLDKELVGKETGKDYDFEFEAIDAFGKKDAITVGCLREHSETFLIIEAIILEIEGIDARRELDHVSGLTLLKL